MICTGLAPWWKLSFCLLILMSAFLKVFPLPLTPTQSIFMGLLKRVGAAKCSWHLSFLKFFRVCSTIILAD